ncbi:MAG: flagellar hook-associated protein FlgL [Gammaproteobacteria bacterium]|nr:flagellar hook-associated protein FlgL [Gammaproteobacteria bacterium]
MRITTNQVFSQSLTGMLSLQEAIQRYQTQLSSGKRLLTAADDPVAAAQSVNLSAHLEALKQYDRNSNVVTLRLSEQDTAVGNTQNALQRVRELILQAKNGALSTSDRRAIAAEVGQRMNEVLNLANQKNSSDEYVFAGTAVAAQPFTANAAGTVLYNGNQNVRALEIADGRVMGDGFSGAEVFMAQRNGNGTFVTNFNVANTGTGRLINAAVTNIAAVAPASFQINFTSPTTYDVVNVTSGATVLAAQPYTASAAINFNGISVAVTGAPNAGDRFLIGPSQNQSIFATISKAQQDMSVDATSPKLTSDMASNLDRALSDIDQAMSGLDSVRAQIGARQNALDSQTNTNADLTVQIQTIKAKLEDVDPVAAISNLARQTQALAAAQQAFVKVQGLSLFNYLR